jgi:hypothetical protein
MTAVQLEINIIGCGRTRGQPYADVGAIERVSDVLALAFIKISVVEKSVVHSHTHSLPRA